MVDLGIILVYTKIVRSKKESNKMEIKVTVKNVYGKETIYPACPVSEGFAEIAGMRTLTPRVVQVIKSLGYFVNVIEGSRPLCCQVGNH